MQAVLAASALLGLSTNHATFLCMHCKEQLMTVLHVLYITV